jgi:hypothetical protein
MRELDARAAVRLRFFAAFLKETGRIELLEELTSDRNSSLPEDVLGHWSGKELHRAIGYLLGGGSSFVSEVGLTELLMNELSSCNLPLITAILLANDELADEGLAEEAGASGVEAFLAECPDGFVPILAALFAAQPHRFPRIRGDEAWQDALRPKLPQALTHVIPPAA